jgi:hypothetical protein
VGGTLDTVVRVASTGKQAKDPDRSFGRETRSLKAVYELMSAGYSNVLHLKGGLSQWRCGAAPRWRHMIASVPSSVPAWRSRCCRCRAAACSCGCICC